MATHGNPGVRRWTGVAGLASFVLFGAGNVLWAFEQPAPDAAGAAVVRFYETASDRIVAGGLIRLTSIAVFAVFAVALRRVLLDRGAGELLADAVLAGAVLGLAPGLGAESINAAAALRAGDGQLGEPLALALFDVSYVLGSYAVGPGFGVFTLALSAAALRDPALLPRWAAVAGLVVGAALVTPLAAVTLGEYTVGPAFLIAAFVAARLLRAQPSTPSSRSSVSFFSTPPV